MMCWNAFTKRRSALILVFAFSLLLVAATPGAALAADTTNFLYATGGEGVRVYEADSGTPVQTIPGSGTSTALASGNSGRCIYVAEGASISAIDTSGNTIYASVNYPDAASHISCMVTGSDNRLYVADSYLKSISIYTPDLTLAQTIPANPGSADPAAEGYLPVFIAVSPDGSRLYAGCAYGTPGDAAAISSGDYSLLIFDAQTGERLKVVGLYAADSSGNAEQQKYRLASMKLMPAGDYLWLGVYLPDASDRPVDGTSQLLAISLPVTDSIQTQAAYVPPIPYDLAASPDGSTVYALASYSGNGGLISYGARSFQVDRLYTMSNIDMRHEAISPDGSKLYISNDKGYSLVSLGSGSVTDFSVSGSIDQVAVVGKELASPLEATPTPVPATPTPEPATPTPSAAPVLATSGTSPTAPGTATSTQAQASPKPTATPIPLPSQGTGNPFSCLTVPLLSAGAVVALRPAAGMIRRMWP